MKKKLTYDNFGKYRHSWIYEADRICMDCEEFRSDPPGVSPQATRHWRRAAKLYERAADFYRKAGLGRMAAAAWWSASFTYGAIELLDDSERCAAKAKSIPSYYQEDDEEGL